MLEQARVAVPDEHVEFRAISGERLDGVEDASADVVVCYLVLQHLPSREVVLSYVSEFARVLKPAGEAFVQLPVLEDGLRPRIWRATRSALVPLTRFLGPTRRPEFRGYRLRRSELDAGLARAGLRVVATDFGPDTPYRFSRDLFLRLTR
jgi:SAM-dependent methyltransferase